MSTDALIAAVVEAHEKARQTRVVADELRARWDEAECRNYVARQALYDAEHALLDAIRDKELAK